MNYFLDLKINKPNIEKNTGIAKSIFDLGIPIIPTADIVRSRVKQNFCKLLRPTTNLLIFHVHFLINFIIFKLKHFKVLLRTNWVEHFQVLLRTIGHSVLAYFSKMSILRDILKLKNFQTSLGNFFKRKVSNFKRSSNPYTAIFPILPTLCKLVCRGEIPCLNAIDVVVYSANKKVPSMKPILVKR